MNAPAISNARPTAASGTRTGAISSAAGRIRPTAASTSRTPIALMLPALKSLTHPHLAGSFCLGWPSFAAPLARKTAASNPAVIHNAMSMLVRHRSPADCEACDADCVTTTMRCEVFPADLDAAVDFYCRVLGFDLVRDERASAAPYVSLRRGEVRVG